MPVFSRLGVGILDLSSTSQGTEYNVHTSRAREVPLRPVAWLITGRRPDDGTSCLEFAVPEFHVRTLAT